MGLLAIQREGGGGGGFQMHFGVALSLECPPCLEYVWMFTRSLKWYTALRTDMT